MTRRVCPLCFVAATFPSRQAALEKARAPLVARRAKLTALKPTPAPLLSKEAEIIAARDARFPLLELDRRASGGGALLSLAESKELAHKVCLDGGALSAHGSLVGFRRVARSADRAV